MFFNFIFQINSISHLIYESNSSYILNNHLNLSVFFLLWANWCPHCKLFLPIWRNLSDYEIYQNKLLFSEIECESNRGFCKTFPGDSYPRLYWYDFNSKTYTKYLGERNSEHCQEFIDKQLKFPMINFNESNLNEYFLTINISTIFIFKIPKNNQEEFDFVKNISITFRGLESRFFIIEIENLTNSELISYISTDIKIKFNEKWNFENLKNFIIKYSIPYRTLLNGYILRHLESFNLPTLVSVTRGKINELMDKELTNELLNNFTITTIECETSEWFCRYTSINKGEPSKIYVYFDWKNKLFWVYNNNITNKENILNWYINIKKGLIKGSGPGTGFLSIFLTSYYDSKASGESLPSFLMFIPFSIIILYIIFSIDKNPKKIKNIKIE